MDNEEVRAKGPDKVRGKGKLQECKCRNNARIPFSRFQQKEI